MEEEEEKEGGAGITGVMGIYVWDSDQTHLAVDMVPLS